MNLRIVELSQRVRAVNRTSRVAGRGMPSISAPTSKTFGRARIGVRFLLVRSQIDRNQTLVLVGQPEYSITRDVVAGQRSTPIEYCHNVAIPPQHLVRK